MIFLHCLSACSVLTIYLYFKNTSMTILHNFHHCPPTPSRHHFFPEQLQWLLIGLLASALAPLERIVYKILRKIF